MHTMTELRYRGLLRTNSLVVDLGEAIVCEHCENVTEADSRTPLAPPAA
jgi:hypothetical protein